MFGSDHNLVLGTPGQDQRCRQPSNARPKSRRSPCQMRGLLILEVINGQRRSKFDLPNNNYILLRHDAPTRLARLEWQ